MQQHLISVYFLHDFGSLINLIISYFWFLAKFGLSFWIFASVYRSLAWRAENFWFLCSKNFENFGDFFRIFEFLEAFSVFQKFSQFWQNFAQFRQNLASVSLKILQKINTAHDVSLSCFCFNGHVGINWDFKSKNFCLIRWRKSPFLFTGSLIVECRNRIFSFSRHSQVKECNFSLHEGVKIH